MNNKTPPPDATALIQQVLKFDRFYSRRLHEATKAVRVNEVNVAELGIFHELHHAPCTPGWLSWRLDLDPGQLSRSLRLMALMGHITVCGSVDDRRKRQVSLTDQGRIIARSLEQFKEERVRQALEELPRRQQSRLVRAMGVIMDVLERDALINLLERHADRT